MKALSIRQPWAWLIVNGYKCVENRSWKTYFRGDFLIHASQTFDKQGYENCRLLRRLKRKGILPLPSDFNRGGIIGEAKITGCIEKSRNKWFEGPYGFIIEDPQPLPFKPMKGKLKFFETEI